MLTHHFYTIEWIVIFNKRPKQLTFHIFDFSSETTEHNSTKLDRKQDLNVLYQVCVFRADWKKQDGHLVFPIGPKNRNLVEDVEILLPVKFRWIMFSHKMATCLPHIVHLSTICNLFEESAKADIFVYLLAQKNTNLVEHVEILLPVKFRWILFSGFRGEVKNVSANQRPGRPSCFSDRPEKHKLGRGRWDLASCQVSLNSVQRFKRRSQKCLSQSEARTAILFFRTAQKTQTW